MWCPPSVQIILGALSLSLAHEVSWQLHAHEHSGHEEAEEDADETDEEQQEAVEFGNVRCIGAVQDYKAQASHRKEETGGQSFHNVLAVYSVCQKGHWSLVSMLISHWTHTWRLYNNIVDDTSCDEKVGHDNDRIHSHSRRHMQPRWFLQFYIWAFQHSERYTV